MSKRKVFISYARADAALVRHDAELLRAGGVDVFIDVLDIDYGAPWHEVLVRAIDACERVMVFWSAAAKVSEWVEREWRLAVERGKKVVPTLLDETPLPSELAAFQALQRFALGRLAGSPADAPVAPAAPRPGAAPFRRSRLGLALGMAGGALALAGVAVLLATPLSQRAPAPAPTIVESREAPEQAASSAGPPVVAAAPSPDPASGAAAPRPSLPASVTAEEIIEALRTGEGRTRSFRTRAPEVDAPIALPMLAAGLAVVAIALLGWARRQARLRREIDEAVANPSASMVAGNAASAAVETVTGPGRHPSPPAASAPREEGDRARLARAYAEAVFAV